MKQTFKNYGEKHVSVLADHFFVNDTEKENSKYSGEDLNITFLTPNMPDNLGHMTATEWLLLQLLRHSVLRQSSSTASVILQDAAADTDS